MIPGKVRIIGGKWRGRSLKVLEVPGLRPTPDRVRETLFNWLAPYIVKARCLDLFAGSGALGFEALSRGAKEVVFVDKHPPIAAAIARIANDLDAKAECEIIRASAISYITTHPTVAPFDIIFLDPPFASPLLAQSIEALSQSTFVKNETIIYLESPQALTATQLPANWELLKSKKAGEVAYHLVSVVMP